VGAPPGNVLNMATSRITSSGPDYFLTGSASFNSLQRLNVANFRRAASNI
jgi:hypothetical protein